MNKDIGNKNLVEEKQERDLQLCQELLADPDFTLYKCNPQTLSFLSDISAVMRELYPDIQPDVKAVLDVGARTAIGSWFLQALHHPDSFSAVRMQVTALDIEDRFKAYSEAFFPDITYQVGDIFDLPAASFDIAVCSHTIEHVGNPAAFIRQLCRIARQYVIVACPFEEPENELIPGHLHSINQAFIAQFNPCLFKVYTSMHWHQSQACIFAIKIDGSD